MNAPLKCLSFSHFLFLCSSLAPPHSEFNPNIQSLPKHRLSSPVTDCYLLSVITILQGVFFPHPGPVVISPNISAACDTVSFRSSKTALP